LRLESRARKKPGAKVAPGPQNLEIYAVAA
jgi:hypothetical protein